jgi:hypothetical protein
MFRQNINPCRVITFKNLKATRKRGRPSLRWLDSTVRDIQILGIKRCTTKALGRNQQRSIVEEVKT